MALICVYCYDFHFCNYEIEKLMFSSSLLYVLEESMSNVERKAVGVLSILPSGLL